MNVLIFLDLMQKFQMLLSSMQNIQFFLIFTYNPGKLFLILLRRCIPGLQWKLSHHPWKVWEKNRPVISVLRIIMTVYQHSEIFPSRCIQYTKFFSQLVQFYQQNLDLNFILFLIWRSSVI